MTNTGDQQLLSELARVKVLFQARAFAAAMGMPRATPKSPQPQECCHG